MSLGLRVEDRLDGHTNYSVWKERMQSIFEEAEVWNIMVHTTQNPVVVPTNATELAEYNKKNNKGKRLILDGVKDHCIPHVRGKSNAHEMWTALSNLYQSTNENRKMVLKEKLKNIKMGNDSAAGYLTKITNAKDELAAIGEAIPPTELVRIAVNGLSRSWMNFVDGVCARETLPTWERFWDDCIQTEIRKGQLGAAKPVEQDEDVALSAGGKKGKGKKQASTSNGGGKGKVVCPEKKKKKGKNQSVAASAEVEEFAVRFDQEFGFIAYESSSARSPATQVQKEHAFPSISGASSESGTDIEVVLGDNRVVRAVEVGTLTFQRESKPPLKVTDVLYVPGMRKNLISVSALEDRGYEVLFRGGQVLMYPRGTPAESARVIGVRHAKVYKFAFQPLVALSSSTDSRASSSELRTWIYFLKTKSEVFKRFQEFRTLVETQTGRKIKSLRSDNGGEYTLGEFVDYCAKAGIRREFTVPYNPQQNGVAERKNRSIIGAAKAMLHDQGLPLFLWAEACNTAVYLQNRSPHRALGHMTPEEAFSGKKPDIGHLHIFGCITYSYIPKEKRTN
eukprot:PITA_32374